MSDETNKATEDRDDHAPAPLDPEEARRGEPKTDPAAPVPQDEPIKDQGDKLVH